MFGQQKDGSRLGRLVREKKQGQGKCRFDSTMLTDGRLKGKA